MDKILGIARSPWDAQVPRPRHLGGRQGRAVFAVRPETLVLLGEGRAFGEAVLALGSPHPCCMEDSPPFFSIYAGCTWFYPVKNDVCCLL